VFRRIKEDIQTALHNDPAARSTLEVLVCYPGVHAICLHRLAHWLWGHKLHFLARVISAFTRLATQVEIHPGATLGRRVFIDHGAGVVIGETSDISDDVLIYQGVVLGGTSMEKKKRHPTIGSHVVLGARAILLGAIHVGDGARVGAGSVVLKDVPAKATVVGVPGHVVRNGGTPGHELEHARLPDPVAELIRNMLSDQLRANLRLEELEKEFGVHVAEATGQSSQELFDGFFGGDGI